MNKKDTESIIGIGMTNNGYTIYKVICTFAVCMSLMFVLQFSFILGEALKTVETGTHSLLIASVLAIIATLVIMMLILSLAKVIEKDNQASHRLKLCGMKVKAEVLEIEQLGYDGHKYSYIVCEAGIGHKKYKFNSRNTLLNLDNLKRKYIPLIVNPNDCSEYYIDINKIIKEGDYYESWA